MVRKRLSAKEVHRIHSSQCFAIFRISKSISTCKYLRGYLYSPNSKCIGECQDCFWNHHFYRALWSCFENQSAVMFRFLWAAAFGRLRWTLHLDFEIIYQHLLKWFSTGQLVFDLRMFSPRWNAEWYRKWNLLSQICLWIFQEHEVGAPIASLRSFDVSKCCSWLKLCCMEPIPFFHSNWKTNRHFTFINLL